MHCNLRPPEPCQPFPALITTPCKVWSRWTYPLPCYSVFCCWSITLRFDLNLWPLTLNIFSVSPVTWLYTKFKRNRAIRGGVIAISVLDLMTLNTALRVALGSGTIFTKFDLGQLIREWIIPFFDAHTLCEAVTLTFDLLTLNFYIWAKSNNPRLSYRRFSAFSR